MNKQGAGGLDLVIIGLNLRKIIKWADNWLKAFTSTFLIKYNRFSINISINFRIF